MLDIWRMTKIQDRDWKMGIIDEREYIYGDTLVEVCLEAVLGLRKNPC